MRTRFGKTIFGLSETGWKLLEMTVVGVNHGVQAQKPRRRETEATAKADTISCQKSTKRYQVYNLVRIEQILNLRGGTRFEERQHK